jgi:hypothetical protein
MDSKVSLTYTMPTSEIPLKNCGHPNSSLTLPYCNNNCNMQIYNPNNKTNPMPFEVRKVQDSRRCLMVSIPKRFADLLHMEKGDVIKVRLVSDIHAGNSLSLSKVPIVDERD